MTLFSSLTRYIFLVLFEVSKGKYSELINSTTYLKDMKSVSGYNFVVLRMKAGGEASKQR